MSKHDEFGFETPDPTPMTLPIGAEKPLTIEQQMARFLRGEFARQRQEMMPPDPLDNDDEDQEPLTQAELNAVVEDFENERAKTMRGADRSGSERPDSGDSDRQRGTVKVRSREDGDGSDGKPDTLQSRTAKRTRKADDNPPDTEGGGTGESAES